MRSRAVAIGSGRGVARALVAAVMLAAAGPSWADDGPAIAPTRRAAAIGLAVVPGVVVPGLGARMVREPRAARRLLVARGLGLGLMVVGGVPLAVTYGSAKLVVPGVHLVAAGAGVFLGSWWADVYAAAGGGRGQPRRLPELEVGVDTTWLRDGYHGDRALLGGGVRAGGGRWGGAARAALTHDRSLVVARVDGAARVVGGRARHTGSAIDLRAAIEVTRARDERVTTGTGELAARGRLALAAVDPALAGSFFELDAGLGLELTGYRAGEPDLAGVLLSRFAWGAYLPCGRGEVAVFYDNRRDTLAGGLAAGRAAGFFGSVGATAEVVVGAWTVAASAEFGSGWVNTVALRRGLP